MRKSILIVFCFLVLFPFSLTYGQSAAEKLKNLERENQNIKDQLKNLKGNLSELEDSLSTIDDLESSLGDLQNDLDEVRETSSGGSGGSDVEGVLTKLFGTKFASLTGYYDFEYNFNDQQNKPDGFRQHHLALWIQKRVGKFNFFSEIEFEDAPHTAGTNDLAKGTNKSRGEIRIERAWAEYNHNKFFNIRFGVDLIPTQRNAQNYPTFVITANRPLHVRKMIPRDYNGIAVYGGTSGKTYMKYYLFVANGVVMNLGHGDDNEDKALGGRILLGLPSFGLFNKFEFRSNLYYGKDNVRNQDMDWNFELWLDTKSGMNVQIEVEQGRRNFNAPATSDRHSYGAFIQLAQTFNVKYTIAIRGEIYDKDHQKVDRQRRALIAIRYQPLPEVSIKFEVFRHWDSAGKANYNAGTFSFAIFF